MAIDVLRKIMHVVHRNDIARVTVEEEVATYLNNRKRRELAQAEDDATVELLSSAKRASPLSTSSSPAKMKPAARCASNWGETP